MASRSSMDGAKSPIHAEPQVLEVTTLDLLDARAAVGEPFLCGVPLQVSVSPHDELRPVFIRRATNLASSKVSSKGANR